jgi:hypothetical protein
MRRLREFISEHRAAAAIVAAVLVAFAGWRAYVALSAGGPAATPAGLRPPATPAPAETGTAGAPAAGPTGEAALRAAGHLTGTAAPALPGKPLSTGAASTGSAPTASGGSAPAGKPAAPSASSPAPAGTGRPDPFAPLATSGGGGPASANPPLPPVPPLSPGALGPSASTQGGLPASGVLGPAGRFQLAGIVNGEVAVAILNDSAGSYIVQPGDTVTPGVRVVAIDAANHSVTLTSETQSWQLRLGGGTSR